MLNPGQRVPDFRGEAFFPSGEIGPISLADYERQWFVLFSWPLDFTFVCPTEIRAFNSHHSEFQAARCAVIGASVDSAYTHQAWVRHGLGPVSFPLIGDLTRALVEGLDILDVSGVALRATFIVDPSGIIRSASANGLDVGRSVKETIRLVQAFQSGKLTACDWQPGQAAVVAA